LKEAIKKALMLKGFRFIEAVSQCPTAFGRRVGFKNAAEMVRWFKENSIPLEQAEKLNEEDLTAKIIVGEFVQRQRPTLTETVYIKIKEAQKNGQN
jgi:2-oxoglutarate ferredoxin oxidoreductase subunit beta